MRARLPGRSDVRGCHVAAVADPFTGVAGARVSVRAGRWPAIPKAGRVVTGGGQWLAVLLALAGSACFAIAAVTQQEAAARLARGRPFDPMVLVRLARRPAWLAGLAAVIAGFAFQAAALGMGRLVVIEPVLASGLLFALILAARRDRRPLRRAEWAAALAVFAGLAVFLTAGQPAGGQRTASVAVLGVAAGAAAGLTGLSVILAGRFAGSRRALLFGVGGGVAAGVTDALVKTVVVLAAGHVLAPFADPRLYLLIAVGLLAYTIQQNGYRAAGLAAFLPAFAVIEPVVGSLLGLIIYHERLHGGPGRIAVELVACIAATWGIARLAGSAAARPSLPTAPAVPSCTESTTTTANTAAMKTGEAQTGKV
jgi:drug/metabolite transporter (DMT)-like permease